MASLWQEIRSFWKSEGRRGFQVNGKSYDYDTYLSVFTWRYSSQEMRRIWSEEHKRRLWRRIWVALAEAQHEAGLVTAEQLADLRAHEDQVDVTRAHEIEAEIRHNKMAEVWAFAEQCPVGGGIIHLGATSTDVEDNADVLRLRESLILIQEKLTALLRAFAAQIEQHKDRPCMGYTHLQPAEPTTLGYRLCQYAQELLMDWRNLDRLLGDLKGKGFKGAVGTSASYAHLLQGSGLTAWELERRVMERLGLEAFLVVTQTYPRKQDWLIVNALASVAQSLHKFAFDLRVLQAPPFGELSEPFRAKQVGSSAMPFKRNPVAAESICSLARYVAALPEVAWHNAADSLLERTLDDSANRRLILPQAFLAVDAMLGLARRIVEGLVVREEAIARNLAIYGPFAATEALLMELVKAGADRQAMHELIRQHAMASWEAIQREEENPLRGRLRADETVLSYLGAEEVDALLDLSGYVGDAPDRCEAYLHLLRDALP
jgi:adenylosuccinate lyase